MTQTYRTTDGTRWGAGKGSRLTPDEVDINFWDIIQRIITLETDMPGVPASIDYFEVSGQQFYVHLTDATVLGPYELPVAVFAPKGEWVADFSYVPLDTFTINGGLYLVLYAHISEDPFDAGANDGMGHDYYALMIQTPGNAIPTGGAVGQVVQKASLTEFATTWGWKTPDGGTARQYHIKSSSTQDDSEWDTPNAEDLDFTPVTGSPITSTNLADAVEELATGGAVQVDSIAYTPSTGSGLESTNVRDALDELGTRSALGKQTMWVPASAMTPLLTNGAEAGVIETTTYKNLIKTLDFDPDDDEGAQFEVAMPKSWDGGPISFKAYWSHPTTTSAFTVIWQMFFVLVIDGQEFDASMNSVEVTDIGGDEDTLYISPESVVEDGEVLDVDGDDPTFPNVLLVQVWRKATDGADTMTVDARLQGVQVYYTVNASTDD